MILKPFQTNFEDMVSTLVDYDIIILMQLLIILLSEKFKRIAICIVSWSKYRIMYRECIFAALLLSGSTKTVFTKKKFLSCSLLHHLIRPQRREIRAHIFSMSV